jgi:hypothetical protein
MYCPLYLIAQGCTACLWHETNFFLCLYHFWPSTRRFSVGECSPPSPLKFVTGCSETLAFLWQKTNSFLCLYHFWPCTRRFSVGECWPPSPLKFVTDCSATRAFCDMKLTLFRVSTTSGLLHDVFQYVSVHPIPIEMCYGLLSEACLFLTWN